MRWPLHYLSPSSKHPKVSADSLPLLVRHHAVAQTPQHGSQNTLANLWVFQVPDHTPTNQQGTKDAGHHLISQEQEQPGYSKYNS